MEHTTSHHTMSISRLLLMALLHFVLMYFLMYSMVATFNDVFLNINNFYMAATMTAPMLLIEGVLMGSMYANKKALGIIMLGSLIILISTYLFIRYQTGLEIDNLSVQ